MNVTRASVPTPDGWTQLANAHTLTTMFDHSARIADALEGIEDLLRREFHRHQGRRIVMATELAPGASVTKTATAQYPDPANAGAFLDDPNNPTITWTEDSGGAVISLATPDVTASGVSTVVVTGVADGTANLTATSTDPDGNAVSAVEVVTVVTPAPTNDATQVVIS